MLMLMLSSYFPTFDSICGRENNNEKECVVAYVLLEKDAVRGHVDLPPPSMWWGGTSQHRLARSDKADSRQGGRTNYLGTFNASRVILCRQPIGCRLTSWPCSV
jgi:hypothetical protein